MSVRVHYLNGGYCRHLLASIDGRTWRRVTFHAVFLAIEHPRLGWIVCDTGYGTSFFEATRAWPRRLYRWATPVTPRGTAASVLAGLGVRPEEVGHVIVTHFHADHVGGLREFTRARIHYREDALAPLLARKPLGQTRAAFLPALLPEDLSARSKVISARDFKTDDTLPFASCDLFGDGTLKAVSLPGHAPGQIGLEYVDAGVRTLYCADAFWRIEQISGGVNLPRPVLALQWNARAYRETVNALRALAQRRTHRLLACHDEETQRHVAP
jgi:glyoxylase-like metal-dependent hydrolase (beta-lactamase superfamily II)